MFISDIFKQFQEFSEKANALCRKFERDIGHFEAKTNELKSQIEKSSQAENSFIKAESVLALKISENEEMEKNLNARKIQLDKFNNELNDRKEVLDTRLKYLNSEKEALIASNIEIENKYKYLEIEERRLKLFKHKIDLILEDKEMRDKVMKIGEVKLINEVWT